MLSTVHPRPSARPPMPLRHESHALDALSNAISSSSNTISPSSNTTRAREPCSRRFIQHHQPVLQHHSGTRAILSTVHPTPSARPPTPSARPPIPFGHENHALGASSNSGRATIAYREEPARPNRSPRHARTGPGRVRTAGIRRAGAHIGFWAVPRWRVAPDGHLSPDRSPDGLRAGSCRAKLPPCEVLRLFWARWQPGSWSPSVRVSRWLAATPSR